MSEYTCARCNKTYQKTQNERWNDIKAAEEYLKSFPETKNAPTEIVCDICYKEFMKWFGQITEEEKKQMREDFGHE